MHYHYAFHYAMLLTFMTGEQHVEEQESSQKKDSKNVQYKVPGLD
jgi:hypothetical protein